MAFPLSSSWTGESDMAGGASPSCPFEIDPIRPAAKIDAPEPIVDAVPLSKAAPTPAEAVARSAESPEERSRREARAARSLRPWLLASLAAHASAIAAIALWEQGPGSAVSDPSAIEVELASQPPGGSKNGSAPSTRSEAAPKSAAAARPAAPSRPPQPRAHPPALAKPPPEPPSRAALAKPPPEPPPKTVPKADRPAFAAVSVPAASDPATALPFFAMPGAFASSVLDGQGTRGDDYKGLVFARLARAERFPDGAMARGETGQAIVAFTVDGSGALASLSIARSSGFQDLDAEALAMVRRVAPFPPPPPGAVRSFAAAIEFGRR